MNVIYGEVEEKHIGNFKCTSVCVPIWAHLCVPICAHRCVPICAHQCVCQYVHLCLPIWAHLCVPICAHQSLPSNPLHDWDLFPTVFISVGNWEEYACISRKYIFTLSEFRNGVNTEPGTKYGTNGAHIKWNRWWWYGGADFGTGVGTRARHAPIFSMRIGPHFCIFCIFRIYPRTYSVGAIWRYRMASPSWYRYWCWYIGLLLHI